MGLLSYAREVLGRWAAPQAIESLRGQVANAEMEADYFKESLSRLELDIENEGYFRLTQLAGSVFERKRLGDIINLSVNMAIKNPITKRSVKVRADYVFGLGVRIVAKEPLVQQVIDECMAYEGNRKVLTSHPAMVARDRDLNVYGNLFISCNTNRRTGRVVFRSLDTREVQDTIRDPDDWERVLFIKRTWDRGTGRGLEYVYHPALGIDEETYDGPMPWQMPPYSASDKGQILWDSPVYHVAPNIYGKEKFSIPETYAQIDDALAYRRYLGDWVSIMRSYAKMALKVTGFSNKKQMAAAKGMMNTQVSLNNPLEKNPSVGAGSFPLLGKNVDIEAVKTAGATTPAESGKPVLNMAACAAGFPGTFYGDVTKDGLDRSAELQIQSQQNLWKEVFRALFDYVLVQSAKAPEGILNMAGWVAYMVTEVFENRSVYQLPKGVDGSFVSIFPEVKEHNVTDRVRALVNAVTMFGKVPSDLIPDKAYVSRLLLEALDVDDDIEKLIPTFIEMWKANMKAEDGKPVDPNIIPPPPPQVKAGGPEDPSQGGDVGKNG